MPRLPVPAILTDEIEEPRHRNANGRINLLQLPGSEYRSRRLLDPGRGGIKAGLDRSAGGR